MNEKRSTPKFGDAQCQCTACGHLFNRVSTFDKHRVGTFDAVEPYERGTRRCLTWPEMEARGWRMRPDGFILGPAPTTPWFAAAKAGGTEAESST
jgi:hypothetical protein